jgi:hypothetical protein
VRRAAGAAVLALLAVTACSHADGGKGASQASSTSSTTTTLHFTGDAGSAFCARLKDLDTEDVLKDDKGAPASVEAGFARLRQVLTDTAAQAPDELRRDITAIAAGIAALDDALRSVGYSYDALADAPNALEVSAAVNDPAFTEAGARITAYKQQVCHL